MTNEQSVNPTIYVPGVWKCVKCDFRLVQANLNAADGTVTARDMPGDKCPNCGTPLWRVSWKDEANEALAIAENQMERAKTAETKLEEAAKVIAPFAEQYRQVSAREWNKADSQGELSTLVHLVAAAEWMESFGRPAPELNTESEWRWWSGHDEEFFSLGPFTTREDAIEEARQDQSGEFKDDNGIWRVGVHVVEARIDPLRLSDWLPDGEWLIENADERLADSDGLGEWDDGPIFEVTADQQRDLEKRIKAACDEWQAAHDLTFKTRTFSHMRNLQHVVVPHPNDDKEAAR